MLRNRSHCCYSMRLGVLFLVQFNSFAWTMGFCLNYTPKVTLAATLCALVETKLQIH